MTITEDMLTGTMQEAPPTLVDDVVVKVFHIPTLPAITRKIIQLVENKQSTALNLFQLISHDPALATRTLRLANSCVYGRPRQIGSIDRAIVLLGLAEVKTIVMEACLSNILLDNKNRAGIGAKDLWTHSVAVGIMSGAIAGRLNTTLKEEAFLAGLIHDIGVLVELQELRSSLAEIVEKAVGAGTERYIQIERDVLCGMDHQALGAALLNKWKFPRSFQYVTGYHHEPLRLAADCRWMTCVVYVADHICCARGWGYSLTCRSEELDGAVLRELGLTMEVVETLAVGLPDALRAVEALLD